MFFDLDGTLVDGGATWRQAVSQTIRTVVDHCSHLSPARPDLK